MIKCLCLTIQITLILSIVTDISINGNRDILGHYQVILCHYNHSLDTIFKFPDIAGPVMYKKGIKGLIGYLDFPPVLFIIELQEMSYKRRDVFLSLPQGRYPERNHI